MREIYETVECDNFCAFVNEVWKLPSGKGHSWVFKGMEKACWPLKTTLERECERFSISGEEVHCREYNMIREFQRRLHHYEVSVPHQDNIDEWMALMQHYGAPTRLLDFTYSPYVAAYFAYEKAMSGKVAVWAIDATWISNKFTSDNPKLLDADERYGNYRTSEAFRELFLDSLLNRYVVVVNPFRLNDRLAYQQGLFLCPASVTVGFMANLRGLVNSCQNYSPVKQFTIEVGEKCEDRDEALRQLHQMNINRITLFPGLAGFAESFKVGLMTVYDAHKVMSNGAKMRPKDLWQSFLNRNRNK